MRVTLIERVEERKMTGQRGTVHKITNTNCQILYSLVQIIIWVEEEKKVTIAEWLWIKFRW